MPIFKGIPPGKKIDIGGILRPKASVMCAECRKKFKDWMQHGGERPKPCAICVDKLKNKMYDGMYPDR